MSDAMKTSPTTPIDPALGEFVPIWVRPNVTCIHPNETFYCAVTLAPTGATYPDNPPVIPPAGTQVSLQVNAGAAVFVSPSTLPVPTNGNTVVFMMRAGSLGGLTYSRVKVTATVIKPGGGTGASASNYGPNPDLVAEIYNDLIVIP